MKYLNLFIEEERGEGFVDVLIKMLIVVIIGAALLAIMRTALPQISSTENRTLPRSVTVNRYAMRFPPSSSCIACSEQL